MSKIAEKLARRYAASLVEVSAPQELEAVRDALKVIAHALAAGSTAARALSNPSLPLHQRRDVLVALCERVRPNDSKLQNFLSIILENGRIQGIGEIAVAFAALVDEIRSLLRLEVCTSTTVEDSERGRIEGELRRDFGELVSFRWSEDTALLGGAVVKAGDRQIDGSVRGMLERVRAQLLA